MIVSLRNHFSFYLQITKAINMRSWTPAVAVMTVVGGIVVASYPIIIAPFLNPSPWQDEQKVGRKGLDVEKIQPGGMKVWTDPFDRKKE